MLLSISPSASRTAARRPRHHSSAGDRIDHIKAGFLQLNAHRIPDDNISAIAARTKRCCLIAFLDWSFRECHARNATVTLVTCTAPHRP
jgi:hypothetical protein